LKKIFFTLIFLIPILYTNQLFSYNTYTWTGEVDTNWSDSLNWIGSSAYPNTELDNCLIPSGLINYPLLMNDTTKVRSIVVEEGASLDINGKHIYIISNDSTQVGSKFIILGSLINENNGATWFMPFPEDGFIDLDCNNFNVLAVICNDSGLVNTKINYIGTEDLNLGWLYNISEGSGSAIINMNGNNLNVSKAFYYGGLENCPKVTLSNSENEEITPKGSMSNRFIDTIFELDNENGIINIDAIFNFRCKELKVLSGIVNIN